MLLCTCKRKSEIYKKIGRLLSQRANNKRVLEWLVAEIEQHVQMGAISWPANTSLLTLCNIFGIARHPSAKSYHILNELSKYLNKSEIKLQTCNFCKSFKEVQLVQLGPTERDHIDQLFITYKSSRLDNQNLIPICIQYINAQKPRVKSNGKTNFFLGVYSPDEPDLEVIGPPNKVKLPDIYYEEYQGVIAGCICATLELLSPKVNVEYPIKIDIGIPKAEITGINSLVTIMVPPRDRFELRPGGYVPIYLIHGVYPTVNTTLFALNIDKSIYNAARKIIDPKKSLITKNHVDCIIELLKGREKDRKIEHPWSDTLDGIRMQSRFAVCDCRQKVIWVNRESSEGLKFQAVYKGGGKGELRTIKQSECQELALLNGASLKAGSVLGYSAVSLIEISLKLNGTYPKTVFKISLTTFPPDLTSLPISDHKLSHEVHKYVSNEYEKDSRPYKFLKIVFAIVVKRENAKDLDNYIKNEVFAQIKSATTNNKSKAIDAITKKKADFFRRCSINYDEIDWLGKRDVGHTEMFKNVGPAEVKKIMKVAAKEFNGRFLQLEWANSGNNIDASASDNAAQTFPQITV